MTEEAGIEEMYINDEVVAAYNEILLQLKDSKKTVVEDPIEIEKAEIIEELTKETPEDTTQHFENLRRSLINGVEDIREQYLSEQKKLLDLASAIESKTAALNNLHKIEINLDSLAQLIRIQKEKSAQFEKEIFERKNKLNHEISEKQKEFLQEEQRHLSERDMNRMKERNQYEANKRLLEQELITARQKFEKDVAQREARILENEKSLSQLKQLQEKVARFPEEIEQAKQTTEESVTQNLTLKFDYEMQLAKKEMRIYEQTISSLEAKIALLESNIARFESLKESFSRLLSPTDG